MKTILTIITLITLLCAATAPAQESIQNQLDQIAQNQRDIEGAIESDQIQRQGAEWQAQFDREQAAEAMQNFRSCVASGLTRDQCALLWLPAK